MLSMRELRASDFGRKVREWDSSDLLKEWRGSWGDHVNVRMAELGLDARVEITEIRRQRDDWQRGATRALATGRTGEAIHAYGENGLVHMAETREAARAELVEGWDRARVGDPSKMRIILTHTNAEVRDLNIAAREKPP